MPARAGPTRLSALSRENSRLELKRFTLPGVIFKLGVKFFMTSDGDESLTTRMHLWLEFKGLSVPGKRYRKPCRRAGRLRPGVEFRICFTIIETTANNI